MKSVTNIERASAWADRPSLPKAVWNVPVMHYSLRCRRSKNDSTILLVFLMLASFSCRPAAPSAAGRAMQLHRRGNRYLWSRPAADGGWYSDTYGLLESGQAPLPFIHDTRAVDADHPAYSGRGLGETNRAAGNTGGDLSHTRRILEALRISGFTDSELCDRAALFLKRIQRKRLHPGADHPAYEGGFYDSPVVATANKGGWLERRMARSSIRTELRAKKVTRCSPPPSAF